LDWASIDSQIAGPQHLVPPHDFSQAPLEGSCVKLARKSCRTGMLYAALPGSN